MKKLCLFGIMMLSFLSTSIAQVKDSLPSEWDWRDVNGYNWTVHRSAQEVSGDIVAHLNAFESRIKIVNDSPDMSIGLSARFIDFCDTSNNTAQFIVENGVPDGSWQRSDGCNLPDSMLVKATNWGIDPKVDSIIKSRIMEGPVVCYIVAKKGFSCDKDGIYISVMGKKTLFHAVYCCGWTSSGSWICRDSWMGNYFYCCSIEWATWLSAPCMGVEELVTYPKISNFVIFPNPSCSVVSLSFYLSGAEKVSVNMYDIAGREVCCLANKLFQVGNHKITYNRSNLPPGIYFLKLKSDKFIDTKKLILL